jgi:3-hydroxybutyryl-CoA dehydrogenase
LVAKERLTVAHPYNPPHLVPCIEIVQSSYTSPEALKVIDEFFRSVGREPVAMLKSAPGFIANRLQHALFREAAYMVEAGIATPSAIDQALKTSFAPRYTSIGIFEHFDYAGLDMVLSIEDYVFPTLCNADKAQDLVRDRCERGDLGFKTGKGVYDWSEKDADDFRRRASEPYFRFFNWSLPTK